MGRLENILHNRITKTIELLYSKKCNSVATAISEALQGCNTEEGLFRLWQDISNFPEALEIMEREANENRTNPPD